MDATAWLILLVLGAVGAGWALLRSTRPTCSRTQDPPELLSRSAWDQAALDQLRSRPEGTVLVVDLGRGHDQQELRNLVDLLRTRMTDAVLGRLDHTRIGVVTSAPAPVEPELGGMLVGSAQPGRGGSLLAALLVADRQINRQRHASARQNPRQEVAAAH